MFLLYKQVAEIGAPPLIDQNSNESDIMNYFVINHMTMTRENDEELMNNQCIRINTTKIHLPENIRFYFN